MPDEAVVMDAPVESTTVDASVKTPVETSAETAAQGTEESKTDSSEQSEQSAQSAVKEPTDNTKEDTASKSISKYLKAMADNADPEAKSASKRLRDAFFGEQEYRKTFASVTEAREARALLSEIAGGATDITAIRETWASTKETLDNIAETDALLYQGSPDVVANVVSDLKSEGKIDALPKLTQHFLEATKAESPEAYVNLHRGLIIEGLYEIGFPQGINALSTALKSGNADEAKSIIRSIVKWFTSEQSADRDHRALTKAESQRSESQKQDAETKYQSLVQESAKNIDSLSNVGLGKELGIYLKTEFGKTIQRPELEDLARSIKGELHSRLDKDGTYKSTVEKFLRAGDKTKAIEYHRLEVNKLAKGIVDKITNTRYPSKLRGTSVAKKAAVPVRTKATASSGEYVYVAQRPDRSQMDMAKTKDIDLVLGRAILTDGRRVTWRANHKIATKN